MDGFRIYKMVLKNDKFKKKMIERNKMGNKLLLNVFHSFPSGNKIMNKNFT